MLRDRCELHASPVEQALRCLQTHAFRLRTLCQLFKRHGSQRNASTQAALGLFLNGREDVGHPQHPARGDSRAALPGLYRVAGSDCRLRRVRAARCEVGFDECRLARGQFLFHRALPGSGPEAPAVEKLAVCAALAGHFEPTSTKYSAHVAASNTSSVALSQRSRSTTRARLSVQSVRCPQPSLVTGDG
uniref:Uncharacterized protein n=1 Tax=Ralstonia solanacearum TaxID=305 RepID=A0A0S4UEB3_RALSL|nr:protein of unknown function [Ralstonia solanacearum]